jgi:hypothetical protein
MGPRYVVVAPIVHEMKTHVRMAAAALILVAVTTSCQRTTEGSVATTTEPGPPVATTTRPPSTGLPGFPEIPIPDITDIPIPTPKTDLPEVPAPANAVAMKCSEFNDLDDATRLAVIRAILASKNNPLGPDGDYIGLMLAEGVCQFLPDAAVSDALLGPTG